MKIHLDVEVKLFPVANALINHGGTEQQGAQAVQGEEEDEACWRFVSTSLLNRPSLFLVDKNPKAFAYANPGRLAKSAARSHDVCLLSYLRVYMLTTYS